MKAKEISKMFGLPVSTLRYYEQISLIEPVPKKSNVRIYGQNHIDQLTFIQCMKRTGMSLVDIKSYLTDYLKGPETGPARINLLRRQQDVLAKQLQEIYELIDYLDTKIEHVQQEH